jgi:hypothetical protein
LWRRGKPWILFAPKKLHAEAVEATCAQYRWRFKRTGRFWSPAGDEALLCLDSF